MTDTPFTPEPGNVYHMDALALLKALPDNSVDAVITDMPYGTTACTWDTVVDLAAWWEAVKHALKPRGVMVTTASQPFTSALVMSNPAWFKYEWIWDKKLSGNFLLAQTQPLKTHENVLIFSCGNGNYTPQMSKGQMRVKGGGKSKLWSLSKTKTANDKYYPSSIIRISNTNRGVEHPTQKPIPLYEYLIRTYTQPGDLILDPFAGSGTTLVAARNLNRRYIGGDITPEYVEMARKRLAQPYTVNMFETLPE